MAAVGTAASRRLPAMSSGRLRWARVAAAEGLWARLWNRLSGRGYSDGLLRLTLLGAVVCRHGSGSGSDICALVCWHDGEFRVSLGVCSAAG
jgi:hypothetical protein